MDESLSPKAPKPHLVPLDDTLAALIVTAPIRSPSRCGFCLQEQPPQHAPHVGKDAALHRGHIFFLLTKDGENAKVTKEVVCGEHRRSTLYKSLLGQLVSYD